MTKTPSNHPSESNAPPSKVFDETLVLFNDFEWLFNLVKGRLDALNMGVVRMPATTSIRSSWNRFKSSNRIIIFWESQSRGGGPIVEEILDVSPLFDIANKVIVLIDSPTHEDIVYLNELGIQKIVRVKQSDKAIRVAAKEITNYLKPNSLSKLELEWRKLFKSIDYFPKSNNEQLLKKIEENFLKISSSIPDSAKTYDVTASIDYLNKRYEQAEENWHKALDMNPNYYRAYNNLIKFFAERGNTEQAFSLLKKMQLLNKNRVSRLVQIGDLYKSTNDSRRAEHYYNLALEKDNFCSGALNGKAELHFNRNELTEARDLLTNSSSAYEVAKRLNLKGVELVKSQKYEQAMELYTKAQFVLPAQDKGPLLFFNIALCYFRWEKISEAKEFAQLALIKDPSYLKAENLLKRIESSNVAA